MKKQTEESGIKSVIRDYLRLKGIFFYHNLQSVGSFKGLPDLTMHLPNENGIAAVHYLEVKAPKGKLSEYQLAFQKQCRRDFIPYSVIRSLEDLREIVG